MWTVLMAALLMSAPEEQFDAPAIPAEWTHDHQALAPMVARSGERLLAPLGPGRLSLHRAALPPHQAIRLSFDLYFVGWWDGASFGMDNLEPDVWSCGPRGGPALIAASFNNTGKYSKDMSWQSFPENHRDAMTAGLRRRQDGSKFHLLDASAGDFLYPFGKGAFDHGHLGQPSSARQDNDSRYRLNLLFRHRDEVLDFDFGGKYKHGLGRQWYGIDRVQIDLQPQLPPLSAAEESGLWLDLLGDAPEKAMAAKFRLALYPEQALRQLQIHCPRSSALPLTPLLAALRLPETAWATEKKNWLGRAGRRQLSDVRLLLAQEDRALAHLDELIQAAGPTASLNCRQLWRLADLHRLCGENGGADFTAEIESLAALTMPGHSEAKP